MRPGGLTSHGSFWFLLFSLSLRHLRANTTCPHLLNYYIFIITIIIIIAIIIICWKTFTFKAFTFDASTIKAICIEWREKASKISSLENNFHSHHNVVVKSENDDDSSSSSSRTFSPNIWNILHFKMWTVTMGYRQTHHTCTSGSASGLKVVWFLIHKHDTYTSVNFALEFT